MLLKNKEELGSSEQYLILLCELITILLLKKSSSKHLYEQK